MRIAVRFAKHIGITLGESPEDARDRCWELSLAFSSFCKGMGEQANMVHLVGCRQTQNSNIASSLVGHHVVQLPKYRVFVDWTARQFWPEADHPWILDLKTLKATWDEVDGLAPKRTRTLRSR